jgi:ADP-heptose:LPS heptosyltransferase
MSLATSLRPLAGGGLRRPKIGVFRALVLGDMLCAVPALRALRAAWPQAEISLIGLPWAAELVERLPHVDRFIAFPGHPGLPERPPDIAGWPGFVKRMQGEAFDLLLQMHGSGRIVNPMLATWGATQTAGFVEPGGYCANPELHTPWPTAGHEIDRLLALTDHLGIERRGRQLEFPVNDGDRRALGELLPQGSARGGWACLHPGAQLASRRWLPDRFAAIGDALAEQGHTVFITGTAAEAPLAEQVCRAMRAPALSLAGKTTLWTLGALIEGARLLVCNDTGVSHVAAALGTPSVVVSLGADVSRWAPLDAARHRVLWKAVPCRPCAHAECPVGHGCATGLSAAEVAVAAAASLSAFSDHACAPDRRPGRH